MATAAVSHGLTSSPPRGEGALASRSRGKISLQRTLNRSMTSTLVPRRASIPVDVGGVVIGGDAPIVVQSMTNTDTADVEGTARQSADLARAGSEIVRITVDRDEAAKAVPKIRDRLLQMGVKVPLVGDFHYNGHTLLGENPACAEALDKYRINPGNVGFKGKRDRQFSAIIELALKFAKPVRIGVNWGSLDQELLTRLMDENATSPQPKDARAVMHEAIVQSALLSAERAEELGLGPERIVISAKVSAVQDLVSVYTMLAERCRYALHLGLTEAGMGSKGIVASTAGHGHPAAAGHRRHHPRLAHPRARRRPHAGGAGGAGDPADHGPAIVRADRRRLPRLRPHHVDRVPGAGERDPGLTCARACRSGSRNFQASRA